MEAKITFDEWIRNPSKSRSRIVGERDIAKSVYSEKYNKMILLCGGKIEYQLFHEDTKRYIIYVKMPSDTIKGITYDVVVEFSTEDQFKRRINNLNGYRVKFFSNDPNFIFTYAYTYNQNGLLCSYLKDKINAKALKDKPKITNPNTLIGYVKSFYFTYIFMQNKGLFNKLNWLQAGSINQMNQIFKNIMQSDEKLRQVENVKKIQKSGTRIMSSNDPKALEKAATVSKNVRIYANKLNKIKTSNRTKFTRSSSTVKHAKKV